jgi:hypothetical protein
METRARISGRRLPRPKVRRGIYNLCFHHEISAGGGPGIEAGVVAELCARDWGLWRTCKGTIERCRADLGN